MVMLKHKRLVWQTTKYGACFSVAKTLENRARLHCAQFSGYSAHRAVPNEVVECRDCDADYHGNYAVRSSSHTMCTVASDPRVRI